MVDEFHFLRVVCVVKGFDGWMDFLGRGQVAVDEVLIYVRFAEGESLVERLSHVQKPTGMVCTTPLAQDVLLSQS